MKYIIEGDLGDYVAYLDRADIDDIFGSGPTAEAALADLRLVLSGSLEHLLGLRPNLSPRLERQVKALQSLAVTLANEERAA